MKNFYYKFKIKKYQMQSLSDIELKEKYEKVKLMNKLYTQEMQRRGFLAQKKSNNNKIKIKKVSTETGTKTVSKPKAIKPKVRGNIDATISDMKSALSNAGVTYKSNMSKAELENLVRKYNLVRRAENIKANRTGISVK